LFGGGAEAAAAKRPNVIFILVDDLRFDAIGALNPKLHTPNIDRMVKGGILYRNAFVTTSLCSPSRATILTGETTRNHHVVGNEEPEPKGLTFFPSYLQKAGYRTAMIGKWHMGRGAQPRAGFDHWVSFAGQGVYLPSEAPGGVQMLNIDGKSVPQKGYITDELTDYALDWLGTGQSGQPFFLYLSHKGVHENFTPAARHQGQYAGLDITPPASSADSQDGKSLKPRWVQTQRNSWHGADYAYYGERPLNQVEKDYFATLSAVDDSVGRVLDWLKRSGHTKDTVVMLMGDNGFLFGEHGLIDKRNAYEESMRVPLVAYGDRKSTRLNSSHNSESRMPSSA
jgi:arylsulfatase A-like enzyme